MRWPNVRKVELKEGEGAGIDEMVAAAGCMQPGPGVQQKEDGGAEVKDDSRVALPAYQVDEGNLPGKRDEQVGGAEPGKAAVL